jgi:NAD(P)-dependent dehydrogenase (short-subunit alcohol dehydrogenase family)
MNGYILITGASRGIGLALTEIFLKNDYTVFTLTTSISDELKSLTKINQSKLYNYICDVTKEETIVEACEDISIKTQSIDIIINNAAIHLDDRSKDLDEIDFISMKKTYDVNSIGPLRITKHFISLLKKGLIRRIVNISSEAGSITDTWRKSEYGYCMSKSALNMASKILQNRYKEDNIKVLAIHPGWVSTDMGGNEAPIKPHESAEKVYNLMLKNWNINDTIYYDLDGKEMSW